MEKKKILVVGKNIDTTALDTDKVLMNITLDGSQYIAEITLANFKTLIYSGQGLIDKIAATESTIATFAAASGDYTFQQGDIISLAGSTDLFMYVGGTKTDVANYVALEQKSQTLIDLETSKTIYDLNVVPVLSVDAENRELVEDTGNSVVLWNTCQLKDLTEVNSANWNTRLLQDTSGVQAVDWDERKLKDVAGAENADFSEASIKLSALPTYDDNAAALTGGLVEGQLYVTPSREVKSVVAVYAGVKRYKALISQRGTNAPTAVILENTLGEVPTFSYVSSSVYKLTTTGLFTTNKTFVIANNSADGGDLSQNFKADVFGNNSIEMSATSDDVLRNASLLIEVYP
jgi:hypothetical protein